VDFINFYITGNRNVPSANELFNYLMSYRYEGSSAKYNEYSTFYTIYTMSQKHYNFNADQPI